MTPHIQNLINEIINVVPATKSEFYLKSVKATNRLHDLKQELTDEINKLEEAAKK